MADSSYKTTQVYRKNLYRMLVIKVRNSWSYSLVHSHDACPQESIDWNLVPSKHVRGLGQPYQGFAKRAEQVGW